MPTIFEKLNLKDQKEILVLNAPASFEPELASLVGVKVCRDLAQVNKVTFALVFAARKLEVDSLSLELVNKAAGDAILWFAYPKGTSKKYRCDFNRDNGWEVMNQSGYDPVRMVAIDEDWSALRFRKKEHIKR